MSVNKTTIDHLIEADGGGGEDSLLSNLISVFQNATRVRIEQLGLEIEHGNHKVAAQLAHVIKASAANLGALSLAELCQQIEDAVNSKAHVDFEDLYARIVKDYNDTLNELTSMSAYRH